LRPGNINAFFVELQLSLQVENTAIISWLKRSFNFQFQFLGDRSLYGLLMKFLEPTISKSSMRVEITTISFLCLETILWKLSKLCLSQISVKNLFHSKAATRCHGKHRFNNQDLLQLSTSPERSAQRVTPMRTGHCQLRSWTESCVVAGITIAKFSGYQR
jgi:hypothetical protein